MFTYPWTNFHELNLDWILATLRKLIEQGKIAPEAATEIPLADNIVPAVGDTLKYAREDHKHPAYFVTPQMFGAAGDGIKDDTTAIQDAFDNEKHYNVFFPAGTYKITKKLVLPRDNKVSVQFDNATILAAAAMDAVIELDNTLVNMAPSQSISGSGLIDCNSQADCGILLHNNAGYFHITGIQIRNIKSTGITVGDDTSVSLGVIIDKVLINGNANDRTTIGLNMIANDCIISSCLIFRCGIGIQCSACTINHVHIWAEQDSAEHYAETIGIKILSNYARFSQLYIDSVGTGIDVGEDCNAVISDLLYVTDYTAQPQTLYMIKAYATSIVNVTNWSVIPRNNVKYVPLKYNHLAYYQNASRNFKGTAATNANANIDPRSELCNIARNGYFDSLTKYFGPYSANVNYLMGYIRVANNTRVSIDFTISTYSCTIELTPGATPVLRSATKHYGNLSGNILLGPAETGPCGDTYYPVYLVVSNPLSTYTFITFNCHGDCGNSGFYPMTKQDTTDLVTVQSVSPVLTIALP